MSGPVNVLPTAARLYYTGVGSRRYKRASVQSGPGEPLCFKSVAEEAIRRARAEERAAVLELIEAAQEYRKQYGWQGNPWQERAAIKLDAALANIGSAS